MVGRSVMERWKCAGNGSRAFLCRRSFSTSNSRPGYHMRRVPALAPTLPLCSNVYKVREHLVDTKLFIDILLQATTQWFVVVLPEPSSAAERGIRKEHSIVPQTDIDLDHTVTMTLAFLYQFNNGLSRFLVIVSSTYAQRLKKSSCVMTLVNLPVIAR